VLGGVKRLQDTKLTRSARQTEAVAKQERDRIERDGQIVSPNVYYMHQTVGASRVSSALKQQ
jgi:hypothetical protein